MHGFVILLVTVDSLTCLEPLHEQGPHHFENVKMGLNQCGIQVEVCQSWEERFIDLSMITVPVDHLAVGVLLQLLLLVKVPHNLDVCDNLQNFRLQSLLETRSLFFLLAKG